MSWYFARPGSALAMLSRFFSSIAVTELSSLQRRRQLLLVVGHQAGQLLGHRRGVGAAGSTIAWRRSSSTPSRSLALRISVLTCWLRSRQDPGDVAGGLQQVRQGLVAAVERLATAGSARRTSGPAAARSGRGWSTSVSSDWLSAAVSVPAVFVVSSLTASVSEYGDDVRDTGMTSLGCSVPLPADSSVSTRSPSSVPVRMCAVVSSRARTLPSMVKPTSASPLSQRHVGHRADLDARTPSRRCRRRCHPPRRTAPDSGATSPTARSRSGCKPDRDDEDDQDDADEAGPDECGSAILQHLRFRAPSVVLLDPGEDHGAALQVA